MLLLPKRLVAMSKTEVGADGSREPDSTVFPLPPTLVAKLIRPVANTVRGLAAVPSPNQLVATFAMPAARTELLPGSVAPLVMFRAKLNPRLPRTPDPSVVAEPLSPTCVAAPNKPPAVAAAFWPSAVAKVNALLVVALAPEPTAMAAPINPSACAVASPTANAALNSVLEQSAPPPIPKI